MSGGLSSLDDGSEETVATLDALTAHLIDCQDQLFGQIAVAGTRQLPA
jgi:hypothetical protein